MSLFTNKPSLRSGLIKITPQEFVELRDFIYQKSGIWVDEKRKYLFESRFRKRIGELGLNSFSEYVRFLKFDTRRNEELKVLFELVTTNETSFFRDRRQLEAFRDNVLTEVVNVMRKIGRKELYIWSAGCSSGEEPYTLAMLVHEVLGVEIGTWKIKITAVDLSEAMIKRAKAAEYGEYAFKTTSEEQKKKYFLPTKDGFKVKPNIAKMVDFQVMNLNDRLSLKRLARSQIVFCRNVIIYFDADMKKRVVGSFYDNLLPGGYLMLGHSESLHKISQAFKPVFYPGTIAYQKV